MSSFTMSTNLLMKSMPTRTPFLSFPSFAITKVKKSYNNSNSISFPISNPHHALVMLYSSDPLEFTTGPTPGEPSFPVEMPKITTSPDLDPLPPDKTIEVPLPPDIGPDFPRPPFPSPPDQDIPRPPIPSPLDPEIPLPLPPDVEPPQPPDVIPPKPPGILPPPSTPPDLLPPGPVMRWFVWG